MDKNLVIALIVFLSLLGGVILYGIISAALSIANEPNFEKNAEAIQIGEKTFYYNQYHIDTFPGDREFFLEVLDVDKKTILTVSNILEVGKTVKINLDVKIIYDSEEIVVYDLEFKTIEKDQNGNKIDTFGNHFKHIIIYENNEYKFIEKDSLPEEYNFLKEYINNYHRPAE